MRIALDLAQKGRGNVHPNPLVGAIIVKNETVIGKGFHEKRGQAHAEVNAISDARSHGCEDFSDTILYVTLEPCCHYGKTPPCTDLIISCGIKKVIFGMNDPNPLVQGKGKTALEHAGITVIAGVLESECISLNRIFIKYITKKVPFVLLKTALSLDGKIATSNGESRWISCEESRADVHRLRNEYTAVMCGINTVLEDNPLLNIRLTKNISTPIVNPIRIITDSTLRIPFDSNIVQTAHQIPTIIATIAPVLPEKKEFLENAGVTILCVGEKNGKVNLNELMIELGKLEIDSILLEGGSSLSFSALESEVVDCIRFYIAPILIGGEKSKNAVGGKGFIPLSAAAKISNIRSSFLGTDIIIEGDICSQE